MGRVLRPGPASLEGLRWLARVGPAPLDAWRTAMGWSEVAARSHARRLEAEGWLARFPMTRGTGSLFVATRSGNRVLGLSIRPAGTPAPTWWAHHRACAWAAAYLQLRGRTFLGDRELLDQPGFSGRISWTDAKGHHAAGHRPDLVGLFPDGRPVALEVELTQKSLTRLRAILTLHARWRAEGRTSGVLYVCRDQDLAERITSAARAVNGHDLPGVAVRLLDELRRLSTEADEQRRTARTARIAGPSDPHRPRRD
jgi:hypothetical protein